MRRGELADAYLAAEREGDHRRAAAGAVAAMERAVDAEDWWPADVWAHRALWHFERADLTLQAARQARRIGDLRSAAGDPGSARRYYAEAIDEARDIGAEHEQGLATLGMGRAMVELGEVSAGRRLAGAAVDLLDRSRAPVSRDRGGPGAAGHRGTGRRDVGGGRLMARRRMRVGIVGAGVMAEAIIAGLVADRAVEAGTLVASHPRRDRRDILAERHGIRPVASNREALAGAEVIVLAVKPQMLGRVMRELRGELSADQVVVSIVAGATIRTLVDGLQHAAVVRAMPNTPSQIRRGISVWSPSEACTARQRDLARAVLRALGDEREVADETFVAMATALSGTGPTYLFSVMEALIDAGVHLGFPRELAHDLVVETLIGSAEFAQRSELHPAQLRNAVTSPGGTSAAAIYELEKGRIRTVLSDAVWAAYRRTLELGERLEAEVERD